MQMSKTKSRQTPPYLSVYRDREVDALLGQVKQKWPRLKVSEMGRAALKQWAKAALRTGLDANLEPLAKPRLDSPSSH